MVLRKMLLRLYDLRLTIQRCFVLKTINRHTGPFILFNTGVFHTFQQETTLYTEL